MSVVCDCLKADLDLKILWCEPKPGRKIILHAGLTPRLRIVWDVCVCVCLSRSEVVIMCVSKLVFLLHIKQRAF